MSKTLYWLQCGGCGGDTMSMLGIESPNILEFLKQFDVEVLWHPSLSNINSKEHREITDAIIAGKQRLDILCVEGSIVRGPGGTGMYQAEEGKAKKDLLGSLAGQAEFLLGVGTCASFGGIGADGEVEATGLQFHKYKKGGFLGKDFKTRSGLPAINLPGCPCHCEIIAGTIALLLSGAPLELDEYNAPLQWYGLLVHQGCTRNEYHEYRVEDSDFGDKGCLFFHIGCHGPLVAGTCNKLLWNHRSSKTRVGVPCFGCTRPDFPQPYPFFKTRNIANIPLELPKGVDRAHYMAYKAMAAAAAPLRLKDRQTRL